MRYHAARIIAFMLVVAWVAWALCWPHPSWLLEEGKVTDAEAAYQPLGTVVVSNTVGANIVNTSAIPVSVLSAPPVSIGSVVVNPTALQFIAPTGSYSAVPVSILSALPVAVNATAVQAVQVSGTPAIQGTVSVNSMPTVYVTGVPAAPAAVGTTWVSNGTGSPIPVNAGFATVYVTGVPAAPAAVGTVWISNSTASPVPVRESATIGVMVWPSPPVAVGTVWISNGTASPVNVNLMNTPLALQTLPGIVAMPTTYVTGVPAPVGSVFINNTTASPVNAWVANPIATMFLANPTASAANVREVAPVATVFINNPTASAVNVFPVPTMGVMIWPSPANPLQTQPVSVPTIGVNLATADPCMAPQVAKSFATIGLVTATLGVNQYQRIVSGSGALKIYICGCWFGLQSTAAAPFPQVQFVQSTPTATTGGVQCTATASAILSGQYTGSGAAAGNFVIGNGGAQVMSVGAGNSLCIIATPNANLNVGGVCSYIQQ